MPSDNIGGMTVAIPTNISGVATSAPAGPVCVPYETTRGEGGRKQWRSCKNIDRVKLRKLGVELSVGSKESRRTLGELVLSEPGTSPSHWLHLWAENLG